MTDEPKDTFEEGLETLREQAEALRLESEGDRIDSEFQERLKKLEDRADSAQAERQAKQKELETRQKSERTSTLGLGVGLSVAYVIIGMPIAGWAIGLLIDKQTGGVMANGIGMLIGAVLGIVAVVMILNKHQNKY
ncbi:MAG TPA: AtpZ/AtpI family protein [Fimbriimonadaceae bacterium]|nr:AtpZ/AtpI family protein [Fimbriimonadaceae bacterium]